MSDFFAPSYWYGAGPDFSGLANAQASQAQTNNWLAQQQAQNQANTPDMTAWSQATNNNMTNLISRYVASNLAIGNGWGGAPGRVGTISNPTYTGGGGGGGAIPGGSRSMNLMRYGQNPASPLPASPAGSVESGGAPPAIPWQNPFQQQPQQQRDTLSQIMAGGGGGGIGSDAAASAAARLAGYQQQFKMPSANPSYFNPGIYGGDRGSFGIPYKGASMPGDIGFSRQPTMPNIGYNPGMQNLFANPGMSGGAFQNRFGLGFGGQAPTMRPDYSSNPLTPTDIYRDPFQIIPGG